MTQFTQLVNPHTVLPYCLLLLFKEIILKKLFADYKIKEEIGQRPVLVCGSVCVSLCECVFAWDYYRLQFGVIGNVLRA